MCSADIFGTILSAYVFIYSLVAVRGYYISLRCINICVCLGLLFAEDKIMIFAAVFCTDIYKLITTYRL